MRDMKLKLNPTYCIIPAYTTEGKGRKKKNILNSVSYKFSFNRGIIANGVVTKKDVEETLEKSVKVLPSMLKTKLRNRIFRALVRVFAPLL